MRIVCLGDSHLARVRRDLPVLGPDVCNAAEGGASALDLIVQATSAGVREDDLAGCRRVPLDRVGRPDERGPRPVPGRRVSVCDLAGTPVVRAERIIAPLGPDAFVSDGLHLSGRAYKMVLPAIAEALRAGA
jgi:hypothetical protein